MVEGLDPRLLKALNHPLRVEILHLLDELGVASPSQLSHALETPLGVVSYHVRRLESLRFVVLARQQQRRGAIEHFYRAREQTRTSAVDAEFDRAIDSARLRARVRAVQQLLEAPDAPARFERSEAMLQARTVLLDEDGRRHLADAIAALTARARQIAEESAARGTRPQGERAQAAELVVLLFDAPLH